MLLDDRPGWMADAACAEAPSELGDFFPARGDPHSAARARAKCARCPVLVACLQNSLDTGETIGIRAGVSERRRRPLRRLWLARDHDYDPLCANVGCWCAEVRRVVEQVDRERERDQRGRWIRGPHEDTNGATARCGYRATYARGCRCPACCFAVSALGRSLSGEGFDTRHWWLRFVADAVTADGELRERARVMATKHLAIMRREREADALLAVLSEAA